MYIISRTRMCLVFWHLPTWLYCRLKQLSSLHAAGLRQKWQWDSWLKIPLLSWLGPHKALGKNVINSHWSSINTVRFHSAKILHCVQDFLKISAHSVWKNCAAASQSPGREGELYARPIRTLLVGALCGTSVGRSASLIWEREVLWS